LDRKSVKRSAPNEPNVKLWQKKMVDAVADEWPKRMQDHLNTQQVNLVMRYISLALFYLMNDMLHMLSISLFVWYLWDNFRNNLSVWKAQNAHLQVII
jgi:hypothetical protein